MRTRKVCRHTDNGQTDGYRSDMILYYNLDLDWIGLNYEFCTSSWYGEYLSKVKKS